VGGGFANWAIGNYSTSTLKRNRRNVNTQIILDKVMSLPIQQWSYKAQDPSVEHIGPMAQDFWRLFHLGDDSLGINEIDPAGIALAAIQALHSTQQKLDARVAELESLRKDMSDLRAQMQTLMADQKKTELRGK
jgi:hypothetical protein